MTQPDFQAITVAIGKRGIEFFTENLIAGIAVDKLQELGAPHAEIYRDESWTSVDRPNVGKTVCSNYKLDLNPKSPSLEDFNPEYKQIQQLNSGDPAGSEFKLTLDAENFVAKYTWHEEYHQVDIIYDPYQEFPEDKEDEFPYSAHYGKLAVDMILPFTYNSTDNTYNIEVNSVEATPSDVDHNDTPEESVLQVDGNCFSDQVADISNDAISAIDFGSAIETVLGETFATIPDSGNLGNGISFDFALGKDGLAFPNCNGIQIAVTGVASYNGKAYNDPNPPTLPIPAVPADNSEDHINIYVSDWAINGFKWAYFKAGLLYKELYPTDIANPDLLKTATYPSLEDRYGVMNMRALVTPFDAPSTAFQLIYSFTEDVMARLEQELSEEVFFYANGFAGYTYVDENELYDDLSKNIDDVNCTTIIDCAKQMGMVTTQNVKYQLEIILFEEPYPNIIFNLERVDVMTNLELGIPETDEQDGDGTNGQKTPIQSMKFKYRKAKDSPSTMSLVSTTVDDVDESDLEGDLGDSWEDVAETKYAEAMDQMGGEGVPLPNTQGFQFIFPSAVLNIEKGFVSISSEVEFRSEYLPDDVARLWMPLSKVNGKGRAIADSPAV